MGSETNALSVEEGTVLGQAAAAAAVEPEKSRRALLKGLGVAAGALVGVALSPREAAAHGTLHIDSNNADPAIHGENSSFGDGVEGESNGGIGVFGHSVDGLGVAGVSVTDTGVSGLGEIIGVSGVSHAGTAVKGRSVIGTGVDGSSESLIGVNGFSLSGIGVEGRSDSGIGVDAFGGNVGVIGGSDTGGTGVHAANFGNGLALNVVGPARFSTAGAGTIPAQQNSVVVSDSAVTADSHITMTLTGDPGSTPAGLPAVVVWIERQPGTGFIARLSRRVATATPFTYFIIEPG
jgi:hypothetical protein